MCNMTHLDLIEVNIKNLIRGCRKVTFFYICVWGGAGWQKSIRKWGNVGGGGWVVGVKMGRRFFKKIGAPLRKKIPPAHKKQRPLVK